MMVTLKQLIIWALLLTTITACNQPVKQIKVIKAKTLTVIKKDTVVKKAYPLTDSGQLMLHLDSLPKYRFGTEPDTRPKGEISLSAFRAKKLFHIPIKLIPIQIGPGDMDYGGYLNDDGTLPDSIKVTFDLADSITYKTTGTLVATTPKFVVFILNDVLLTSDYKLNVIDAIHTWAGGGNTHWHVGRDVFIKKNLSIKIHHWGDVQVDEERHFHQDDEYENWFIDNNGFIKKKPGKKHKQHDY